MNFSKGNRSGKADGGRPRGKKNPYPENPGGFVRFDDVSVEYGAKNVLGGMTFDINGPGIFVFEGPSGCGKSTLARLAAGLEAPTSGSVVVLGGAAVVFQEPRLIESISLAENVMLARKKRTKENREEAVRLLARLGLEADADTLARDASGGMKQRTAVARAVFSSALIIVADEPFSALDAGNRQAAALLLEETAAEKTVVLTSHGGALPFGKETVRAVFTIGMPETAPKEQE
jgi:ABC-type nitrate/sulfonate/bicarbonate transport system ATPase subunit